MYRMGDPAAGSASSGGETHGMHLIDCGEASTPFRSAEISLANTWSQGYGLVKRYTNMHLERE